MRACKECGAVSKVIGRAWFSGGGKIERGWFCAAHDPGRDNRFEMLCHFCDEPKRAKWSADLRTFRCDYHHELYEANLLREYIRSQSPYLTTHPQLRSSGDGEET